MNTVPSENPFDSKEGRFFVLINDTSQYSLWPEAVPIPRSWKVALPASDRNVCVKFLSRAWTDLVPRPDPAPIAQLGAGGSSLDHTPLHFIDMFANQVRRTPQAVAIVCQSESLTYHALDARSNELAARLAARGVGLEKTVAVALPRGRDLVISILAILKCGGVYLPVDVSYETERTRQIMAAAAPTYVIYPGDPLLSAEVATGKIVPPRPEQEAKLLTDVDNGAYLIFTSGSTGVPKGVIVTHRGISSLVRTQIARLGVKPDSTILQFSSPGFDAFIFELCMALATGAKLVIANDEARVPGENLAQFIAEHGVTHAVLTPTVLTVMPQHSMASVRVLIAAGEACPPHLIYRWARGRRFFNAYGPTESTVCATISKALNPGDSPAIGRPVDNTRVYVLNDELQHVPSGVAGEMYIAGAGVARGYLNRPFETASRFVADPYGPEGSRMYRSGDIGRVDELGQLHFLQRADDQVKVRGFRIELSDVEAALCASAQVAASAATVVTSETGEARLIAYLVPQGEIDMVELRRGLNAALPGYMLPSRFLVVQSLPYTTNGKLDRQALARFEVTTQGLAHDQTSTSSTEPTLGRRAAAANLESSDLGVDAHIQSASNNDVDASELVLARLFRDLTGSLEVRNDDDFFEIGGTSITAVKLADAISSTFGIPFKATSVLREPTVVGLAGKVTELLRATRESHSDSN